MHDDDEGVVGTPCPTAPPPRAGAQKRVLGVVGVLAVAGAWWWARAAGIDAAAIAGALAGVADSPWGLPATIGVFIALGLVGVPQFALMAATAATFGPERGFAYAFVANVASAAVGHQIGRSLGLAAFERRASARLVSWGSYLKRHGFAASALVRVVPAGPFYLVNAFAGAVGVSRAAFLGGTALGSVPKVAAITFGTTGAVAWWTSGRVGWAALALVAVAVVAALRRWARRGAAAIAGENGGAPEGGRQ